MSVNYGVTFAKINNQENVTAIAKLGSGLVRVATISTKEQDGDIVAGVCIVKDDNVTIPYVVPSKESYDPNKLDSLALDEEKILLTFTNTKSIDVVIAALLKAKSYLDCGNV